MLSSSHQAYYPIWHVTPAWHDTIVTSGVLELSHLAWHHHIWHVIILTCGMTPLSNQSCPHHHIQIYHCLYIRDVIVFSSSILSHVAFYHHHSTWLVIIATSGNHRQISHVTIHHIRDVIIFTSAMLWSSFQLGNLLYIRHIIVHYIMFVIFTLGM